MDFDFHRVRKLWPSWDVLPGESRPFDRYTPKRIIENEIKFLTRQKDLFKILIIDILLIHGNDDFYLLFSLKIIIKTRKNKKLIDF